MNKQNKIIVGVVALILALTIGYAVFSQSLNIKGTAKAEGSLDIVFSEVGEISPHGTNTPTATITESGRKLELSEITLDYPTAYVDIPVTIINNGTVDGVLESITVESLETDDIKVTINGVFVSSESTQKLNPLIKTGTITKIINNVRNPYLLDNGNIGWVNDSVIVNNNYLSNPNYKGTSIVDALNEINIDSSYNYRTKLANVNGINNYTGSAEQNTKLLNLLKKGILLKI